MRHNKDRMIHVLVTLICMMIILLVILLTPAKAYEGEPVRTEKQETLHEAADILRSYGYAEDSEAIRALGDAWRQEQEALDIIWNCAEFPTHCKCDQCGREVPYQDRDNYCPNCGARRDGDGNG